MSSHTVSNPATTYATPMSFLDTSVNATGNILTGNANFACTAQNLGIVTGTTTFTQCDATTAPETSSVSTDITPTFTGLCAPNTLVTLYSPRITYDLFGMPLQTAEHYPIPPSVLCTNE